MPFLCSADAVGGALQSLIPTFKKTDVPANVVPTPPTSPPLSSTLIFNAFLNISFFVVALTTRRFKHLWVPHMCVLVGAGVAHEGAWQAALKRLGLRERMVRVVCAREVGNGFLNLTALFFKNLTFHFFTFTFIQQ